MRTKSLSDLQSLISEEDKKKLALESERENKENKIRSEQASKAIKAMQALSQAR